MDIITVLRLFLSVQVGTILAIPASLIILAIAKRKPNATKKKLDTLKICILFAFTISCIVLAILSGIIGNKTNVILFIVYAIILSFFWVRKILAQG